MERRKYENLTNFLEGKFNEKWDERKLKQLEKETRNFEIKYETLFFWLKFRYFEVLSNLHAGCRLDIG